MGSSSWSGRRIAGAAGIGLVVLNVVLFFVQGDSPVFDDSAADVRKFFVDDDTLVHLVTWLGVLAFVFFFLPFAAGLRNLLAPADAADEQMWSRLSYTGAVLSAATVVVGSAFFEVLSQGVAEEVSDATLVALARFDTVLFLGAMPWACRIGGHCPQWGSCQMDRMGGSRRRPAVGHIRAVDIRRERRGFFRNPLFHRSLDLPAVGSGGQHHDDPQR